MLFQLKWCHYFFSESITRTLGGDELEGDGETQPAGGSFGGQSTIRFQTKRGRGMAWKDGGLAGQDEAGRDDRRCFGGANQRTKGRSLLVQVEYEMYFELFVIKDSKIQREC